LQIAAKDGVWYAAAMVQVTIELPEAIAEAFGKTAEARQRAVLEIISIEAYREGQLSHRQAGNLLGLDYWQTEDLFLKRGVPLNYTVADLEADRATLKTVLGE
jgi:predicted HTH domain antitoxin